MATPKSLLGKRTEAQFAFDQAVHGWAFCTVSMLQSRVDEAATLVAALRPDDARHETLIAMRAQLKKAN